jgi:putative CocE/NonD family hydrolase
VLAGSKQGQAELDSFVYDPQRPVPTLGGAQVMAATAYPAGAYDQRPVEVRDDVLVYTSPVLSEDVDVVGWVSATLTVASTAPDTDFTAKLVDVEPSGRALNVCDGARRLRLRDSLSVLADHVPGEPYRLEISLDATAHRFRRGHAIRLEVSSSNFPRFAANPNSGGSAYNDVPYGVAVQKVFHSAARPSYLSLPVVGGTP